MTLSDRTFTRAQKRRIKRRWKRAVVHLPESFDHLARRAELAQRIKDNTIHGKLVILHTETDCDGARGTMLVELPATMVAFEAWCARCHAEAEGPWHWQMIEPWEVASMLSAATHDALEHAH